MTEGVTSGGVLSDVPFLLLGAAVLTLWVRRHLWAPVLALAVIAAYLTGALTGDAAVWLGVLALACYGYTNPTRFASPPASLVIRIGSLLAIVMVSLALGLHTVHSFHNREIVAGMVLGPRDAPYDIWLNFDKTAAGLVVLALCYGEFISSRSELAAALAKAWLPSLFTVAALVLLNVWVGYVVWEPKWTNRFWLWAGVSLFATCMSEEAFFRAFLQRQLTGALAGYNFGVLLAIALSATLFGLAHFAGGWRYVGLASVAGVGYGYAFHRTQRIEMSMLAHFVVNALQFLLFSYPYRV